LLNVQEIENLKLLLVDRRIHLFRLSPAFGQLDQLKRDTNLVLGIQVGIAPVAVKAIACAVFS
jgi:hypothetical protein